MSILVWDEIGTRTYETGIDHGVLYLADGSAIPWNGLTSITESFDKESTPTYFDGQKINDLVTPGDFAASMKAVTYPDEFLEFEGLAKARHGLHYDNQRPKPFCLSYRTLVGNDVDGTAGYKIHILYNVTALPNDKAYNSSSESISLTEFEWNITAVPEEVPGFYPTAHIVIDSRDIHPLLLQDIETMLYGNDTVEASLTPMAELVAYLNTWFLVKITDNGDGTWTAQADHPGYITFDETDPTKFILSNVNATYLDPDTYEIEDTVDFVDEGAP